MPQTKHIPVVQLKLDLKNFRTVPQKDEASAIRALISLLPEWFWALTASLLDDGYLPTENVLVLKTGKNGRNLEVKEGNRRIGAMKLIHGFIDTLDCDIPSDLQHRIDALPDEWKVANKEVPCAIYEPHEVEVVDKIVTLTHGKAEQAARAKWVAVARARHNRQMNGAREWALDLLESFLERSRSISTLQKERWSGGYNLTVLQEAVKRIAPRLGSASAAELVDKYVAGNRTHRSLLDSIVKDVGTETLNFKVIRDPVEDFALNYGVPPAAETGTSSATNAKSTATSATSATAKTGSARSIKAVSMFDPRSVSRALRAFAPKGKNRDKLVTLRDEARRLKLRDNPLAFCFVLRCMFELSAKAYCGDHARSSGAPKLTKTNGDDRKLVDVLRDICGHLEARNPGPQIRKRLHGAMTELQTATSVLSVTSMNQLVHNPNYVVDERQVCRLFASVFPLLEEMNR